LSSLIDPLPSYTTVGILKKNTYPRRNYSSAQACHLLKIRPIYRSGVADY
jgi:hypothetical protein